MRPPTDMGQPFGPQVMPSLPDMRRMEQSTFSQVPAYQQMQALVGQLQGRQPGPQELQQLQAYSQQIDNDPRVKQFQEQMNQMSRQYDASMGQPFGPQVQLPYGGPPGSGGGMPPPPGQPFGGPQVNVQPDPRYGGGMGPTMPFGPQVNVQPNPPTMGGGMPFGPQVNVQPNPPTMGGGMPFGPQVNVQPNPPTMGGGMPGPQVNVQPTGIRMGPAQSAQTGGGLQQQVQNVQQRLQGYQQQPPVQPPYNPTQSQPQQAQPYNLAQPQQAQPAFGQPQQGNKPAGGGGVL